MTSPVILIILDGWGIAPPGPSNAIAFAKTPFMDKLQKTYPFMLLEAGGQTVGLPWGAIGNSEVGHSIIGSGRVLYQDLPKINQAILDGSFFDNKAFLNAIRITKERDSSLHLIGLVSGAGGHSYDKHLYSLLGLAKRQGITKVFIHAILDGRDSPYNSGLQFMKDLTQEIKQVGVGSIASLSGRYFAMDRDKRWDRTQKAYEAMVLGKADYYSTDTLKAIEERYGQSNYDEELTPTVITHSNQPVAKISENDSVILFNFRPDRVRQLTRALALPDFKEFKRTPVRNLCVVTMTQYDIGLPVEIAFPPGKTPDSLAEVISRANLFQLHIAETEKYAHITYFLGGGHEEPWPRQDNILVPSPLVSSYAEKPEMSSRKITAKLIDNLEMSKYSFIALNFANADMVGHTGNFEATVRAVEILDKSLQKITLYALKSGGRMIITADHGNAEQMHNEEGEVDKEHSDNPVPFILVGEEFKGVKFMKSEQVLGGLYDIAPTVIDLLNLPQPGSMTGKSLLQYLDTPIIKEEIKKPTTFLSRFLGRFRSRK